MPIQQIMIDGEIADDAEVMAEMLGFSSVDRYIMHLICKDIQERLESAKMQGHIHGIEAKEYSRY